MHTNRNRSLSAEERINREAAEWVRLLSDPTTPGRVFVPDGERMELDRRVQHTLDEYRAAMIAGKRTWGLGVKVGLVAGVCVTPAFALMEVGVVPAMLFSTSIATLVAVLVDVWRSIQLSGKRRELQQRILELQTLRYAVSEPSHAHWPLQTSRQLRKPARKDLPRANVISLASYRKGK